MEDLKESKKVNEMTGRADIAAKVRENLRAHNSGESEKMIEELALIVEEGFRASGALAKGLEKYHTPAAYIAVQILSSTMRKQDRNVWKATKAVLEECGMVRAIKQAPLRGADEESE